MRAAPESASASAPTTTPDRVCDVVVDHRPMPGARLREEELAQAFAASPTPVPEPTRRDVFKACRAAA